MRSMQLVGGVSTAMASRKKEIFEVKFKKPWITFKDLIKMNKNLMKANRQINPEISGIAQRRVNHR